MAGYTSHTSERSIKAIINAGKLDPVKLNDSHLLSLSWAEKLEYLINERLVDENQLVTIFARSASLTRVFPEPQDINESAFATLPYKFITEHSILPYQFEDSFLKVLILDPRVIRIKNELKEKSQHEIMFDITSYSHMQSLMQSDHVRNMLSKVIPSSQDISPFGNPVVTSVIENHLLGGINIPQELKATEAVSDEAKEEVKAEIQEEVKQEIKAEVKQEIKAEAKQEAKKEVKAEAKKAPAKVYKTLKDRWNVNDPDLVMDFCSQILIQAVAEKASDIHIESFRDFANIRMRKDGAMTTIDFYGPYLFKNYAAVTTRFKIMANCDIAEKRLPQDGAITIKDADGSEVDFRFNVMPTKNGERIVMRILAGDPALSLDKIGFDPEDYKKVIDAITAPQGMVLVTGPTGSGKTTTLYGALLHINKPDINILTAEDPVEYYLEGAGQVQANEKIGLSFSSILRAFLRQDPEVILIGEIRDQETIDIAIKAALTGHLLLSTLHTNDAISTVTRILNMGVPNFMISSAVTLIVAQRLARKNCPGCSKPDSRVTPEILKKIGFTDAEIQKGINALKGEGCVQCGGKGLKGRRGIYEVLKITKALEEAILRNEQAPALLEAAKQDGFKTMQEIGREFIVKGEISIEEFQSTLSSE